MSEDRLEHLREVGRLLWPAPLEMTVRSTAAHASPAAAHREYLLLPNRRRPRLLVPVGRRAAAGAVRRYGVGRGRSAGWQAAGLAAGMATGLAQLVLRDRVHLTGPELPAGDVVSIETHLAEVLGSDVLVSMYLGAPRANRKPVLQVLTPDGATTAFVKVGIDPLTCTLVQAETAALRTLAAASLRRVTVPTVLHSGRWNGLELLVQSALPVDGRHRPGWGRVLAAQAEVAGIGRTAPEPLSGSAFWSSLSSRIGGLPPGPASRALTELGGRIVDRFGGMELPLGAWHGDWTPWNTAMNGDRLLVWDWERFGQRVPVGFDALHWALQTDLVSRLADPGLSADRCLRTAPAVLAPFGLSAEQARVTAVSYLTELATRYLADRQAEAGARLGDVGVWLLPSIDRAVAAR